MHYDRRSALPKFIPRAALALAGLCFPVVVAEVALRITGLQPPAFRRMEYLPDDPIARLGGPPYVGYAPGTHTNQVYFHCDGTEEDIDQCKEERRIPFDVNTAGYRDHEYDNAMLAKRFRIMCVGDSFTVADGVNLEDAWPARVEHHLAGVTTLEPKAIRIARQGWSTREQSIALASDGLPLDPNLVIVQVYLNDALSSRHRAPIDAALRQVQGDFVRDGWVSLPTGGTFGNVRVTRLNPHASYVLNWVSGIANSGSTRKTTDRWHSSLWNDTLNREGLAEFDWALGTMVETSKEDGLPFLVVLFPSMDDLGPDYPYTAIHLNIARRVIAAGLPVLDLLEPLRTVDPAVPRWAHPSDHHPSPEMHDLAAKAIVAHLRTDSKRFLAAASRSTTGGDQVDVEPAPSE